MAVPSLSLFTMAFNKYYLLAIIIAVVVLLGLFSLPYTKTPDTAVVVSITDEGFVSGDIKIQKGTEVIFRNDGQRLHWPASNFHPTHTLYPEEGGCIGSKLDACKGLQKGEKFEFVFDKVGKWPLHDHLYPGFVMVVEVTSGKGIFGVGRLFKKLFSGSETNLPSPSQVRELSYTEQLSIVRAAAKDDPVNAWEYVKSVFIVNGQTVSNAHEFAHIIGNAIYSEFGLKGIKNCDTAFAYGCFHGVSEKLLQDKGAEVVKEVQDECIKIFPPEKTRDFTGCIHGMGHGLLTFENLDLTKALEDCDRLDDSYKNYCYDGVFMENASSVREDGFSADNPWKFCKDLPEKYHHNCARYQSMIFTEKFHGDIKLVIDNCAKATTATLKNTCFESTGYYVSQKALGDFDTIKQGCFNASNIEGRGSCVIGAARETTFQRYQGWATTSEELCQILSGDWVSRCLETNQRTREIYGL